MQLRILNNNVHVHITLHTTGRAWFMCMESSEVPYGVVLEHSSIVPRHWIGGC
jgi:hypothetical protein